MHECLPRAIRNRPEPRYNKGGAIAVVKLTESLNSWYRSLACRPLFLIPPFFFWPILRCYPSYARTKLPRERWERGLLSFFSPPEDSAITWRVYCTRVCMSFSTGIWSTSVSFSLSEERIYHAESRWVERNSMVLEVRILTECARWNCCPDRGLSRFVHFNEAITVVFEGLRLLSLRLHTLENLKNIWTVKIS